MSILIYESKQNAGLLRLCHCLSLVDQITPRSQSAQCQIICHAIAHAIKTLSRFLVMHFHIRLALEGSFNMASWVIASAILLVIIVLTIGTLMVITNRAILRKLPGYKPHLLYGNALEMEREPDSEYIALIHRNY